MRKLLRLLLAVGILGILLFPMPVLAIDDPDTPPAVNAVYVYEDLDEDGDVGVLIDYFFDYSITGNPTETATAAYIASFVDIDGATQLKTVAPYTYQDSGYGRGLIWIYFTAAEVTADNITSGNIALYEVWLMGNPTLDWDDDPPKTIAGIDDWQVAGSNTAVLLALRVLYYADQLELLWSLDLIEETALGNRLTTSGESYFVNVIPGLRSKAPSAFSAGTYDPIIEDLDYATSFGAILTDGTGTAGTVTATETLRPDGAGDETNIDVEYPGASTHWEDVDEDPPDEHTTCVATSSVAYLRDLYNIANHSVGGGTINHITVYARCNGNAAPDQESLKIAIKSNVTVSESGEKTVTTSYADYSNKWTTDPDTGLAWTWAAIDSLQVGVSLRRCQNVLAFETRCTQVYVVVAVGIGSPITLTAGANNVDVLTLGTLTIELNRGTEGTATSDVCDVVGSPTTLRYGTNTITTETLIGNIVVDVELVTTQTILTDTITGTGLDLTDLATEFGMSRLMFSGLVWLAISVIICAPVYRAEARRGTPGGGKIVMLVFDVCIIAGAVLGLLSILIAILLFIGFGAFTGYVLFFRQAHV